MPSNIKSSQDLQVVKLRDASKSSVPTPSPPHHLITPVYDIDARCSTTAKSAPVHDLTIDIRSFDASRTHKRLHTRSTLRLNHFVTSKLK